MAVLMPVQDGSERLDVTRASRRTTSGHSTGSAMRGGRTVVTEFTLQVVRNAGRVRRCRPHQRKEGPMGHVILLGARGDREIQWDAADPESTAKARKAFEGYVAARFLAFSTPQPGGDATRVTEFDPEAGEIVITRPLIG